MKLLNEIHHTMVVGECLIELNRREFRVVLGIHALIAENSSYLIYSVHTSDYQPF